MHCQTMFHEPGRQRLAYRFYHRKLPVILLLLFVLVASAEGNEESLQKIYDKASDLAQMPDKQEEAIDRFREVIEIHQANEKIFEFALSELAEAYERAGRAEDGIRYFIKLANSWQQQGRSDTLREIFSAYQIKYPELIKKIAEEMQNPGRKDLRSIHDNDLVAAIVQREDPDLREKSLGILREMLAAGSEINELRSGLETLHQSLSAKFDRQPFRPLVIPLLKSEESAIRMRALQCLPRLDATVDDLALVIPMAEDESSEVRMNVTSALVRIDQGKNPEVVIPVLTKLLNDPDEDVISRTVRSMWGQYSSPEFDALLIKLSRERKYHHNVIYFCLSTMRRKSVPVCERLVEELADPDWNNSSRAAWGLTYGVVDEARSLVEDGLLAALPEEMNDNTRKEEFRALRNVVTEKSRPYLMSVIESEMETEKFKQEAREVLKYLDRQ